jgi:hypothetical protein
MIQNCQVQYCPQCHDALIHQTKRGEDESSSAFGQFVHDTLPKVMYWSDVDGVSYKKETNALRIVEHKRRNQLLTPGQKLILPLLAKSLQLLTATRLIHEQSGVFVVHSDDPHDGALVEQIRGWTRCAVWPEREMSGQMWFDFLQGEVVDINAGDVKRDGKAPAR